MGIEIQISTCESLPLHKPEHILPYACPHRSLDYTVRRALMISRSLDIQLPPASIFAKYRSWMTWLWRCLRNGSKKGLNLRPGNLITIFTSASELWVRHQSEVDGTHRMGHSKNLRRRLRSTAASSSWRLSRSNVYQIPTNYTTFVRAITRGIICWITLQLLGYFSSALCNS